MSILKTFVDVLASYGLACVLFLFLLLLTFLGTLEQIDYGIYEVQQRYFESMLVIFPLFGVIPIPLPGGYLLLSLLFVNLLLGGIIRLRKGWSKIGVLIGHFGILFLLFGGFVEYQTSTSGHLTLFEDERSDRFESYFEWEIAVYRETDDGNPVTEHLIPGEKFTDLNPTESRSFHGDGLPFEITLSGYRMNSEPRSAGGSPPPGAHLVEGFYLASLPREVETERNIAGAYITVEEENGPTHEGILWGVSRYPYTITTADGERWAIDLRKKRFQLPFTVILNKFTRELHPRTEMPSAFSSDITKIQDGVNQEIHISMNRPLRHEGYTLYQASWGPQDAGPNDPLFSTFAVVRNPADQFPLYACIVIAAGLLIHFSISLTKYLRSSTKRMAHS